MLITVYAVFVVAAGSRAAVQIAERFDEAPVAYSLSAFAAAVYVVATVALAWPGRGAFRLAVAALLVELAGVLVIGTVSVLRPEWFDEATVWSHYGRGYLFIPLVLPVLGLWWLWRHRDTA